MLGFGSTGLHAKVFLFLVLFGGFNFKKSQKKFVIYFFNKILYYIKFKVQTKHLIYLFNDLR